MRNTLIIPAILVALALGGCADGKFDKEKAFVVGAGVVLALTLDENSVKHTATLAAQEFDGNNQVATASDPYSQRLQKIIAGLENYAGLNLNFKVYRADDVNAFAMADGTVRVYSGLLDAMPDDQVLAVIGHEIGHVKLKHSYEQMQTHILTSTALQAAVGIGGVIGELSQGQLGQLAAGLVSARFSQRDELESDVFAVKLLKEMGRDPYAMKRAILTLKARFGAGGGFISSHPSNDQRIANLERAIAAL